jgi:AAA15 family ATPase/GTPase
MPAAHIDELTIENFKCFKQAKLNASSKVNLIGGKNNMGKTALLEAIELFVAAKKPSQLLVQLHKVLHRRQNTQHSAQDIELDFFYEQGSTFCLSNTDKKFCVMFDKTSNKELSFQPVLRAILNNHSNATLSLPQLHDKKTFQIIDNIGKNTSVHFIGADKPREYDIALLYGSLIDLDQEHFLDQSLALFDANLLSIKQKATTQGVVLKIKLRNKTTPVLLSSLGDGVTRYIAILCAIWASKDGVLLIDEIENGIHYSNYATLWKLIHQASIDANCQLFITSHSKECIEAFNTVQLQQKNPDSTYIEIYHNVKKDCIQLSQRDPQQLKHALRHEGKIRGE